jgi:hypothetical protein
VYTQGAILHVLATKAVRIHYLCLTPGPTDFQFELNPTPLRGPTAELERTHADHICVLCGIAFYFPLLVVWTAQCLYALRRSGLGWDDPADLVPYLMRTTFVLVVAHCAWNHLALAWPAVASSTGLPLPSLPEPLGFRGFVTANYAAAVALTVAHAVATEVSLAFTARRRRALTRALLSS